MKSPVIVKKEDVQAAELTRNFLEALESIRDRFGAGAIAGIVSPNVTNEAAYLFQKFFRKEIGTNNILTSVGPAVPWSPMNLTAKALGVPLVSPPLSFLKEASTIMVMMNGPEAEDETLHRIIAAKRENNARIIFVGLIENSVSEIADLSFFLPPEGEVELLCTLLHDIHLRGGSDREILKRDMSGFKELYTSLKHYTMESFSRRWGIPVEMVRKASILLTRSRNVAIVESIDRFPAYQQYAHYRNALYLVMLMGHLGAPGKGLFHVSTFENALGTVMMGCSPKYLPCFNTLDNTSARNWFGKNWGVALSEAPGVSITDLPFSIKNKKIRAIIYLGNRFDEEFPGNYNIGSMLDQLELFAVISPETYPGCDFWWKINAFDVHVGSVIKPDRQVVFRSSPEADMRSYFDWEVIMKWFPESPSTGELSVKQILDEISLLLPNLYHVRSCLENDREPCYLEAIESELCSLWKCQFSVSELPRIQFSSIPVPEKIQNKKRLPLAFKKTNLRRLFPDIQRRVSSPVDAVIGVHPKTSRNYRLKKNRFLWVHNSTGSIKAICHVSRKIAPGAAVLWFEKQSTIQPLLQRNEEFVRVTLEKSGKTK